MWGHKFRFLLLVHFLLSDLAHSQAPPPPRFKNRIEAGIFSIIPSSSSPVPPDQAKSSRDADFIRHLVSGLSNLLRGLVHLPGNLSCSEMEDGPWKGTGISHELLGLVMVPVMVSVGCESEAEKLAWNLMAMLGQEDTQELLEDIVALMKKSSLHRSKSPSVLPKPSSQSERQLQAMMFNIQQLAEDSGEEYSGLKKRCKGWTRIKDMTLLGQKFDHGKMRLSEAKRVCRNLGFVCAGVMRDDPTSPESYHAILRPGSRLIPSHPSNQSESWIQSCRAWPGRCRRHGALQPDCVNEKEERVYKVVEWIPTVSTLYNLGTAVYYASMSCSETAKERALMSVVDLGTDTLMAATGGTAGIAGYALGAGLKTGVKAGVKYLLNRMNQEEDLLMNQNNWEKETFSFQK
ncbi:Apolipoprotein F [Bagarius yarrelli]|uniref:Apolipoprotein F n=1 Tax=Bagarius yarrelli TaxID=175774 RepID=A0A556V6H7_BAGYA|nr:Apolipoprotein F [Bagarius yarrelli]